MPAGGVNAFGLTQFDGQASFFGGVPPLGQGVGYGIVVGFGVFFSIVTSVLVWIDYKYGGTPHSSEHFNTAGRSIKTGLTAADIVSKWTWAATLLQSSNVAYKYGVSGPFWYAAGATIQVLLFGILAIEVKRKAPRAHTVLEIVRARWGTAGHLVFFWFCGLTSIIVTAMLLLGGAAVVNALTGMDLYAAAFLIPIGVIMYTAIGGLKATFLASYLHTAYIYVVLLIFIFTVYGTSPDLGSPGKVWENLNVISEVKPVEGNKGGSYLTMFSKSGFIFGVINVIGNFGTVFVDQGYWQSAIAAKPSAAWKGYMLGGICWFAIPFCLATSLGLAANALDLPITLDESNAGLVPPAVAQYLLGNGGGIALLIMLFMAVTSAGSAELIAMSSLFTYDCYRTYIKPSATGKEMVFVSKIAVCVYGCFMGVLAVALQKANVSLGWVYEFMGVAIGSAVIPIACCLLWRKCTRTAAISGAFGGQALALMTWLVWTQGEYKAINLTTTFGDYPMLAGNLCAILSSGIIVIVITLIKPDDYDFESMKHIAMIEEDGSDKLAASGSESLEALDKAHRYMCIYASLLTVVLVIAWPLLALPAGIFSKSYFTFWVIISMIWALLAATAICLLPPIEAWRTELALIKHVFTCTPPEPRGAVDDYKVAAPPAFAKGDDTAHGGKVAAAV